jgi:hypothetical protein
MKLLVKQPWKASLLVAVMSTLASRNRVAARRRAWTSSSSSGRDSSTVFLYHHHQRHRHLECVNTATEDFVNATLGPLYERNTNVSLLYSPLGVEDDDQFIQDSVQQAVEVPIFSLALNLEFAFLTGSLSSSNSSAVILHFVQEEQRFGYNGEHTEELLRQHALLAKFWQTANFIGQPPLLLVALHSEVLQGQVKSAIVAWLDNFGYLSQIALYATDLDFAAAQVQQIIETELLHGYTNPNLSNNAFFLWNVGIEGWENSSAIFIGDGFLSFCDYLGLGPVVNDFTHAHEFGHWLQYNMELEDFGLNVVEYTERRLNRTTAENRQSELLADAMAAYALSHKQGRNFDVALLIQVTKLAFALGDCLTEIQDHHGTPKQRECAVKWGADEGLDMTGGPMSVREFRALFLANLNDILNLDPSVCTLTDDTADLPTPTNAPTAQGAESPATQATSGVAPTCGSVVRRGILMLLLFV